MDEYYRNLAIIPYLANYNDPFDLAIMSGNPKKYLKDLYHSANVQYCGQCRQLKKTVVFWPQSLGLCELCSTFITKETMKAALIYGKKYHHEIFHHYYLFSHIDLLEDIKYCVRQCLFKLI